MIVICIPYRSSQDIVKKGQGSLYYEYRLDFCSNWQDIDFKAFSKNSILTFRGSGLTQAMLQDMRSSKALIDLDTMQLEEFPDLVDAKRLILSTHLDEYDGNKIKAFLDHPQKAKVYKLILNAKSFAEILSTSNMIPEENPRKLIFNVIGKWALFQRGLYGHFSSSGAYVALRELTSAGQPDLDRLMPIWKAYTAGDYRYIAIIGDEQVNNSGSILLANEYLKRQKLKLVYLPVPAKDISEAIELIKYLSKNFVFAGIAITSPYKKAMAQYLKSSLPIINTAQLLDHKHLHNSYHPGLDIYVYSKNTDLASLRYHMQSLKINKDDRILIYGSGDCAEAFIQQLLRHYYTDISLLARNQDKANVLIQKYQLKAGVYEGYDLLINTTPLGKKEEDDISHLPPFKKVIDLALKLDTPALLIQKAESENLPHAQGYEFWARQFYPQFECLIYEDEEND